MTELESLRARLDEVERMLALLVVANKEVRTLQDGATLRANARLTATTSLVRELCIESGISDEEFAQHLSERTSYYHDHLLQSIRSKDANLAGRVDNRNLDEVPTRPTYPPLFPVDIDPSE